MLCGKRREQQLASSLAEELREMRQELQEVRQELQAVRQVQISQRRAEDESGHPGLNDVKLANSGFWRPF